MVLFTNMQEQRRVNSRAQIMLYLEIGVPPGDPPRAKRATGGRQIDGETVRLEIESN